MDIKEYSKTVINYIDNLSDEEFDKLLKESGLGKCPVIGYDSGNGIDYGCTARGYKDDNGVAHITSVEYKEGNVNETNKI